MGLAVAGVGGELEQSVPVSLPGGQWAVLQLEFHSIPITPSLSPSAWGHTAAHSRRPALGTLETP